MKTNEIIFWAKTQYDTRNTASDIGTVYLPVKLNAVKIARDIDAGINIAKYSVKFKNNKLSKAAVGHGVMVKYASGKLRMVRGI